MSYPTYSDLELEIQNLEEENRRLREKNQIYSNALVQEKEEKKKLKEYNGELIENHKKDISILCEENKALRENVNHRAGRCADLSEENEKLKESLDIATKCSSKEEDGIIRLSEENRMLKEKIAKLEFDIEAWKKWKKELGI